MAKRYYQSKNGMDSFGYGARLPEGVKKKEYPECPFGNNYNLNDDLRGIDVQIKDDSRIEKKRGPYPEKY